MLEALRHLADALTRGSDEHAEVISRLTAIDRSDEVSKAYPAGFLLPGKLETDQRPRLSIEQENSVSFPPGSKKLEYRLGLHCARAERALQLFDCLSQGLALAPVLRLGLFRFGWTAEASCHRAFDAKVTPLEPRRGNETAEWSEA